jgi:excisionase family DNA binding protein
MEKPFLTVEEVAKRFGVNVTTIYRLVQRGKIPAFKIGNQWRFRAQRLEEWIADRERLG